MKELVGLTILAWLMLGPTSTCAIRFDVGSATIGSYATFMSTLRQQAQDANLRCYGIPMLPQSNINPKYLLVELVIGNGKSVTLIQKRNNLYVLGYSDTFDSKCRFHIFKDVKGTERQEAETTLCPVANPRVEMKINYESRYEEIQDKAKVKDRSKFQLGIQILSSDIAKISGKASFSEKDEAEFLLVAVQLVAEATRLKYIEDKVKANFNAAFYPDPDFIALEETWGKISTAIHDAKNGAISPPLVIRNDPDPKKKWIVVRVDEIKPSVALLNYVAGNCQVNHFYAMSIQ